MEEAAQTPIIRNLRGVIWQMLKMTSGYYSAASPSERVLEIAQPQMCLDYAHSSEILRK
jgi:hypothetical protein